MHQLQLQLQRQHQLWRHKNYLTPKPVVLCIFNSWYQRGTSLVSILNVILDESIKPMTRIKKVSTAPLKQGQFIKFQNWYLTWYHICEIFVKMMNITILTMAVMKPLIMVTYIYFSQKLIVSRLWWRKRKCRLQMSNQYHERLVLRLSFNWIWCRYRYSR